jgi:hypothetical protein
MQRFLIFPYDLSVLVSLNVDYMIYCIDYWLITWYSHGMDLCTMCDFHGVYLRVLHTICMYKFSRCHVIVFHGFFFPMTDFMENLTDFSY